MGKFGQPKKGKGLVTSLMVVDAAGTPERLGGFMTATTIAFVDSDPDTITDSGSGFLNKMFYPGQRISISGSASNDGNYTIATVTAGTITLVAGDSLAAELAGASVTIASLEKSLCKSVNIQALLANTNDVIYGDSNVLMSTGKGVALTPGNALREEGVYLEDIYVDVTTNGEGFSVTYEKAL